MVTYTDEGASFATYSVLMQDPSADMDVAVEVTTDGSTWFTPGLVSGTVPGMPLVGEWLATVLMPRKAVRVRCTQHRGGTAVVFMQKGS